MADDNTFNKSTLQEDGVNFLNVDVPVDTTSGTIQETGVNFLNLEQTDDRLDRLAKSKSNALERLNSGASLENSFTDLGNGWLESNSNKMWNDLSDKGVQSLYAEVMGKALTKDEQGVYRFSDGSVYDGSVRRAYLGGTKDPNSTAIKFGLARGDKDSSAFRYDPENGGYASGELGIDPSKFDTDVLLPFGAATMLESVLHGRKKALEGRVIKDLYSNPNIRKSYGGGASEYYKSREALFGAPVDVDKELGERLYKDFMKKLPVSHSAFRERNSFGEVDHNSDEFKATQKKIHDFLDKKGTSISSIIRRTANTASSLGSTFVNELFVKPLDAIGDLTGAYDLDTEGDTQKSVEDFFGYNSVYSEESQNRVGEYWDKITDESLSVPDKMRAAGSALLEVFTTPEMLGTSFGALLAWTAPGSVLTKGLGVGSKFTNAAKSIDSAVKAGKITKSAGRTQKIKKFMELDGASGLLASQSGHLTAAVGNVNKQYEEFVANNNMQALEGMDKATFFATRLPIQLLNQNLDKLVTLDVMKGNGVVKALAPSLKAMTNKEFGNVVKTLSKGFGITLKNAGEEAAQEYAQTSMELFNSRFGSEKFKDLDTFTKFLTDDRQIREAGIAALSGAGGAGQFELAGSTFSGTTSAASKVLQKDETDIPESRQSQAAVADLAKKQKTFASDNSKDRPITSFYSAINSKDEDDINKVKVFASDAENMLIDGNSKLFKDKDTFSIEETAEMVEIASAAKPDEDFSALKRIIVKNIENKGKTVTPEDSNKLDKAINSGKTLARLKTMADVSKEATSGIGGFVTYYTAAKTAKSEGDMNGYANYVSKLDKFHSYASEKSARLHSKLVEVEGLVMAEAEALVTAKKAKNIDEALKIKRQEYKKPSKGGEEVYSTVRNSSKSNEFTTKIPHQDVALKLRASDYNRGVYGLVSTLDNEVSGMGDAYKSLLDTDSEYTPVDENKEAYKLPEDIQSWVDGNKGNVYADLINRTVADDAMTPEIEKKIRKGIAERAERIKTEKEKQQVKNKENKPSTEENFDSVSDTSSISNLDNIDLPDNVEGFSDDSEYPSFQDSNEELNIDNIGDLRGFDDFDSSFDDSTEASTVIKDENANIPTNSNSSFDSGESDFFNDDYTFSDEGLTPLDAYEGIFDDSDGNTDRENFGVFSRRNKREVKEQDDNVKDFQDTRNSIKELNKEISERTDLLRYSERVPGELTSNDMRLESLKADRDLLNEKLDTFKSYTREHIDKRIEKLGKNKDRKLKLFNSYGKEATKFKLVDIFKNVNPTGFTISKESEFKSKNAISFLENLESVIPRQSPTYFNVGDDLEGFLLYDVNGDVDYNTAQVMYSAVNDYVLRNSDDLFSYGRDSKTLAKVLGIEEEDLTESDIIALMSGGVTLKLASSDIGKTILKNLGIRSSSIEANDAVATQLGIAALQGYVNKKGTGIKSKVMVRDNNNYGNGSEIDIIYADEVIMDKLKSMRDDNKDIEERLGVKIDKTKSYRTSKRSKPRTVKQHRAEHLNAPKEHTDTVKKLENTPFKFNSGNYVLEKLFSGDGYFDKEALIDKIVGKKPEWAIKDDAESYKAKRFAAERVVDNYIETMDGVGESSIFFDWFIAKNHRIHLDGNVVNPQSDKHITRWLLTAAESVVNINKDLLHDVVSMSKLSDTDNEIMTAKTFAYSIVQAFDGVKGIPGVDKDNETVVLKKAEELLDSDKYSTEKLYEMTMESDHVGHAALAIANIEKYRSKSSDAEFESDMVMEVDGLTNGFAFRSMQYPLGAEQEIKAWHEKVGVIRLKDSNKQPKNPEKTMADLPNMNAAREAGQEDVYISTGIVFIDAVKLAVNKLKNNAKINKKVKNKNDKILKSDNQAAWIKLFEDYGKLQDFSINENSEGYGSLRAFVRNLMKSPTMIFGYAAGLKKISNGLVDDQVKGRNYLEGKGLIPFLAEVHPELDSDGNPNPKAGEYTVSENKLKKLFGPEKGSTYHAARTDLMNESIDSKSNYAIVELKSDITSAISEIYSDPLENTLKNLFSEQTRVNKVLTDAGEFLFQNFKIEYGSFLKNNPEASENDKLEWLKTFSTFVPGVSGASTTDQRTKLMFLKNVLEKTDNEVRSKFKRESGKFMASNTVTRGYGNPGVGPAVLTILSLDSSNLSTSINEFYKGEYANVIPVHDAIVLGVGDYGIVTQYNKDFYAINKRYSIIDEFSKAINALESIYKTDRSRLNSMLIKGKGNNKEITFYDMKSSLEHMNYDIQVARSRLFSSDLKVAQMGGPNGTMYVSDLENDKKQAIEYIKNLSGEIKNVMNSENIKAALGNKYKYHSSILSNMIKGCQ